jgi:NitT/TauT family transport system permease protein
MTSAQALIVAAPRKRPEFVTKRSSAGAVVEQPLTGFERLWNHAWLRKALVLFALAAAWQAYAMHLGNSLLLPTFVEVARAFWRGMVSGDIPDRVLGTIEVLILGYAAGLLLAALLAALAVSTRLGADLLETLTAMMMPLPAIALLPLALIWFGLSRTSLIFVIVQSVVWAVALNTHTGFQAVPTTLRMVGRNCGLSGLKYVLKILIPAAFPSILAGAKMGWAFSWRTLIAAELVFGVTSGSGGLGWYIFSNKNELNIPAVFAGLFTIILIGLLMESIVFARIEVRTVRRWGMQT